MTQPITKAGAPRTRSWHMDETVLKSAIEAAVTRAGADTSLTPAQAAVAVVEAYLAAAVALGMPVDNPSFARGSE